MTVNILETRVDWITLTADHSHKPQDLLAAGLEVVHRYANENHVNRDWVFQGYRGAATLHAAAGWRADGSCVRLGGHVAGSEWSDLYPLAARATRFDVAVTVMVDDRQRNLAAEAYKAKAGGRVGRGRQPERTLIINSRGGSTAYIGRRISERFLRCYNKHVESHGLYPEGAWRYEIEYKRDLADATAALIHQAAYPQDEALLDVTSEFTRAGVIVPWPIEGSLPGPISVRKEPTDAARQMEWLSSSIRPTLERLSTLVSYADLMGALGLSTEAMPARLPDLSPSRD